MSSVKQRKRRKTAKHAPSSDATTDAKKHPLVETFKIEIAKALESFKNNSMVIRDPTQVARLQQVINEHHARVTLRHRKFRMIQRAAQLVLHRQQHQFDSLVQCRERAYKHVPTGTPLALAIETTSLDDMVDLALLKQDEDMASPFTICWRTLDTVREMREADGAAWRDNYDTLIDCMTEQRRQMIKGKGQRVPVIVFVRAYDAHGYGDDVKASEESMIRLFELVEMTALCPGDCLENGMLDSFTSQCHDWLFRRFTDAQLVEQMDDLTLLKPTERAIRPGTRPVCVCGRSLIFATSVSCCKKGKQHYCSFDCLTSVASDHLADCDVVGGAPH